tara:strand:+ start:1225 stop:2616 length:1392 start_codon:yes stop_codon:yes gene_type:complete
MLKQIIILFNLLSFIIITALLPADIKVETKLPEKSSFIIDSTYIVEVDITKGPIYGFAKFQQNIPDGYFAQPVETADASFTFADGKIKFIWMAIPETEHVKISYALIATSDAAAEGVIDGKLSYIEDNERKSYDIPSIPIKAISDEPIVEKVPAIASINRSVKSLGNNEYEVSLTIDQQGVEGFGKLEEYMPEGAEATVLENNKAVFSQVDDRSKFVWMSVPKDAQFNVSYKVSSDSDIQSSLESMEGNFSFLDGNETKTVAVLGGAPIESAAIIAANTEKEKPLISEPVEIVKEEIAAVEPAVIAEPEEVEMPKEIVKAEKIEEVAAMEPLEEVNEPAVVAQEQIEEPKEQLIASKQEKMNVPDPESGVSYKVQLAAGKKLVSDAFLRKAYKYKDAYNVENHQGWVKYTTGEFNVYSGARDKREQLANAGHNFPGPYVTAYNDGTRITVQEALMISNQKWFK